MNAFIFCFLNVFIALMYMLKQLRIDLTYIDKARNQPSYVPREPMLAFTVPGLPILADARKLSDSRRQICMGIGVPTLRKRF